jgi:hypothetical protein
MSKQKILIALILVLGLSYCANAELVGWWRLDETEGTVAWDSSGNELHGEVTGGTTWIPNGRFGGALEFDGVGTAGTNVTLPISQLLNGLTNSTFAIWAQFPPDGRSLAAALGLRRRDHQRVHVPLSTNRDNRNGNAALRQHVDIEWK